MKKTGVYGIVQADGDSHYFLKMRVATHLSDEQKQEAADKYIFIIDLVKGRYMFGSKSWRQGLPLNPLY